MSLRPGPLNLITDVHGLRVGNAHDGRVWSGVTVVLPDVPALAAVDVRGGAPGTRETDALAATTLVEHIDAVVLSGGSAFGLEAASAVMNALASQGRGFPVGTARVPVVPAAILFDLLNGGDKAWGANPPYTALGHLALTAAAQAFDLGNAGAGFGARAGTLKGGLGSVSAVAADGLQVGALVAVNSHGETTMPGSSCFWAWAHAMPGEISPQQPPSWPLPGGPDVPVPAMAGGHTSIGVVATNAALSRAEAQRVAIMAQDGFARAIRPIHTPFDGDSIFALATSHWEMPASRPAAVSRIGAAAADCVSRAVMRAVFSARTLGESAAYRDRFPARA